MLVVPSLSGGGAERVTLNLAKSWISKGHRVKICTLTSKDDYQDPFFSEKDILQCSKTRARYSILRLRKHFTNFPQWTIVSMLRSANLAVLLAGFGLNRNIIFREGNPFGVDPFSPRFHQIFIRLLYSFAYLRPNAIIANSIGTAASISKFLYFCKRPIFVIPNPVLPPGFFKKKYPKANHKWFKSKKNQVILSVGKLTQQKNFPLLLEAFKLAYEKNSNLRLLILGKGSLFSLIKEKVLAKKLQHCVELGGFKKNIYPFFQGAKAFCLTSDYEGFGNVIVEALSFGLPVVSTNCDGGPKDILINSKYGILVEKNPRLIAEALLKVISTKGAKKERIDHSKLYSSERIAQFYLNKIFEVSKA